MFALLCCYASCINLCTCLSLYNDCERCGRRAFHWVLLIVGDLIIHLVWVLDTPVVGDLGFYILHKLSLASCVNPRISEIHATDPATYNCTVFKEFENCGI